MKLSSQWVQLGVLCIVTITAYQYAFYDVARADQLVYLYRTVDIHSLWDLTINAYDFNRTHSVGDFVLFRPILYMLLGLERWMWGYNFTAWQATSISLHIAIVISLFFYFQYVCQRNLSSEQTTFTPFILALFFALLYAGTELVAWHHIVGYLLFCLFMVQTLYAYQKFSDYHDKFSALIMVTLAGLACFTYELGNVLALLLGFAIMATIAVEHRNKTTSSVESVSHLRVQILSAFSLFCLPILYLSWSYFNFATKVGQTTFYRPPTFSIYHLIEATFKAMGFWSLSTLIPSALHLVPGGRITARLPFPVINFASFLGFLLALILSISAAMLFFQRNKHYCNKLQNQISAAIVTSLALGYALIIEIGRGMERGEKYVMSGNSYYSYIFALLFLLAFFHIVIVPSGSKAASQKVIFLRQTMFGCIIVIGLMGGVLIYQLHHTMYHTYSGPIRELIQKIEILKKKHGNEPDFSFSLATNCGGVYLIPWFTDQALEKHERYTISMALFPHNERDMHGKYIINCPKK